MGLTNIITDLQKNYIGITFYESSRAILFPLGTGSVSNIGADHKSCSDTVTEAGFGRALAFDFGKQIASSITGENVGTLYINTCSTELRTYNILDKIFGRDEALLIDVYGKEHRVPKRYFVLVIGDIHSGVTLALQSYLEPMGIPQISPGSPSIWLDNEIRYPNFLRITPSDRSQIRNMLDIVRRNNIKSIGLITDMSSADGRSGGHLTQSLANEYNICIEAVLKINSGGSSIEEAARQMGTNITLPRAFVYIGEQSMYSRLIELLELYNMIWSRQGKILISKSWGTNYNFLKGGASTTLAGSLTFSPASDFSFQSDKSGNKFEQYISTLTLKGMENNAYFANYYKQHFQCHLPMTNGMSLNGQCREDCNLVQPSEGCKASMSIDTEDIVGRLVVEAWLSFAYAIKDAKNGGSSLQELLSPSLNSKHSFFKMLKNIYIPPDLVTKTRDLRVFSTESNQGPQNFDVFSIIIDEQREVMYKLIYKLRDNETEIIHNAQFYAHGEIDENMFSSDCWIKDCSFCPGNIYLDNHPITKQAYTGPETTSDTSTGVGISTLIISIIILLVLLPVALGPLWKLIPHKRNRGTGKLS